MSNTLLAVLVIFAIFVACSGQGPYAQNPYEYEEEYEPEYYDNRV